MRRRRPPTLSSVAALFQTFGGIDIIARLRLCKTSDERLEAFRAAKTEAKIHYHRLAMELHPDRGGDGEKLKEVNAAWTQLQKVKLKPQPVRKSALNVGEARGPRHTSVFVGVTQSFAGSMDSEWGTGNLTEDDFARVVRDLGKTTGSG